VTPRDAADVAEVLRICARHDVPVTPAAGRSGVCGQAVPVRGGVVLDLLGLDRVLDLDEKSLTVTVEPGILGTALEEHLRARGYTLGHRPQSIALSTVGGWIACRSAGQYSTRYGTIDDLLLAADVATPAGALTLGRGVGPGLLHLFVGSEGTLGVVTRATLAIRPVPPVERRAAFAFEHFADGLDAVRRVLRRGAQPAVLRLYDRAESARVFDVDQALLLVLDEGEAGDVDWQLAVVADECGRAADTAHVERWLEHRNDVSALDHAIAAGLVVDTIELAARWRTLPQLYADVVAAVGAVQGTLGITAHCSHAYPTGACLYFTMAGDSEEWYGHAWGEALRAALELGAAITHHHGIGLVRADAYVRSLDDAQLELLRAVKRSLDPTGILNPGKLGL
jgi:alkyldihydroxyacetonephosphate synthase